MICQIRDQFERRASAGAFLPPKNVIVSPIFESCSLGSVWVSGETRLSWILAWLNQLNIASLAQEMSSRVGHRCADIRQGGISRRSGRARSVTRPLYFLPKSKLLLARDLLKSSERLLIFAGPERNVTYRA